MLARTYLKELTEAGALYPAYAIMQGRLTSDLGSKIASFLSSCYERCTGYTNVAIDFGVGSHTSYRMRDEKLNSL
jgi:hypothetical protein